VNSLLSALSGGFSKSLLLSTLLPVVVFVLLALVLVLPQIPGTVAVVHWVQGLDAEWKLAAVTLAVVLLTAVLHNLNGPIIRFYEGYPWCDSWLGRWRTRVHRRKMDETGAQWKGLWTLLVTPEAEAHPDNRKVTGQWNDLARTLNNVYPDELDAVLPTHLGNVVRSFESYPWRQYKMRAITLWPRLAALLDDSYAELIDNAKSSLDFMLNASLLCGVLAVLIATVHLVFPVGLATAGVLVPLGVELAVLGGLCCFFYLAAIPRASAWGMMVKGAFDLFRGKLLESLGYRFQPESLDQEQALWSQISNQMILSDLTIDPLPPYERPKTPPTRVRARPDDIELALLRGTRRPSVDSLRVTIQVRNLDPAQMADRVVVIDTLPEAWAYEWGSADASTGDVEVTGINPYRFKIASLAAGAEARITYRAVSAAPQNMP
jgi:hypothetical protein